MGLPTCFPDWGRRFGRPTGVAPGDDGPGAPLRLPPVPLLPRQSRFPALGLGRLKGNPLDGTVTTQEQVKVTESTISGIGLFGNSGVVVGYQDTIPLIFTGRLANTYTVAPSQPRSASVTPSSSTTPSPTPG